jgi:hypothetical protein
MAAPQNETLEISAIHEAAHCVLKWHLACDHYGAVDEAGFDLIAIRTETETAVGPYIDRHGRAHSCSGISEMTCFFTGIGALDDAVPDFAAASARRKMGHDIVVMLGGPLAEARVRGCAVEPLFERPQAGFEDWQLVLQTIIRMNLAPEEQAPMIATLRSQAEAYLDNPVVWRTITALAKVVLARKNRRLTGRKALPILLKAWRGSSATRRVAKEAR